MTECKPLWLIVGGQRRLGRAVAEDLARDHALLITSSKPWNDQDWATGQRTCVWAAEDPELISTMEKDLGDLTFEGAVIVAGTFPEATLGQWRSIDLERAWAVNLSFPMLVIQALAGRFKEGACLQLVLDASIHRPYLKRLPYSASKAALAALVPGFAKLLAPQVRVVGHAIGTLMPAEGMDPGPLARQGMLGRTGSPEDLCRAIRFATESTFLTGEIITQDGGWRWA